jgi:hypothetical protein
MDRCRRSATRPARTRATPKAAAINTVHFVAFDPQIIRITSTF